MAAIDVRLTDGTTTIALTSGGRFRNEYAPAGLQFNAGYQWSAEGGTLVRADQDNVTETFVCTIIGDDSSDLQDKIQALTRLCYQAQLAQKKQEPSTVYVEVQLDYDLTWWRSPVLTLNYTVDSRQHGLLWCEPASVLTMQWTRRPYWEGPRNQLFLTSDTTTSPSSTAAINNTTDSTRGSWVQIASTEIDGDLPAPAEISINPSGTNTDLVNEIWITNNVYADPTLIGTEWVFEGEDADAYGGANSTGSSSALYSGNVFESVTFSGSVNTFIALWDLDPGLALHSNGAAFRCIAVGDFPAANDYRIGVRTESDATYAAQEVVYTPWKVIDAGADFLDLGVLPMPPLLAGVYNTSSSPVLQLDFQLRSSAASSVQVDAVFLLPLAGSDEGSARYLEGRPGLAQTGKLIDDQVTGNLYVNVLGGLAPMPYMRGSGRLYLVPNQTQRLTFLVFTDGTNRYDADYAMGIQVFYRPRRMVL